jgi:hypothetical protein
MDKVRRISVRIENTYYVFPIPPNKYLQTIFGKLNGLRFSIPGIEIEGEDPREFIAKKYEKRR